MNKYETLEYSIVPIFELNGRRTDVLSLNSKIKKEKLNIYSKYILYCYYRIRKYFIRKISINTKYYLDELRDKDLLELYNESNIKLSNSNEVLINELHVIFNTYSDSNNDISSLIEYNNDKICRKYSPILELTTLDFIKGN